jgi:hypothetical protein
MAAHQDPHGDGGGGPAAIVPSILA